ncbi:hypothetical protein SteCoe_11088 [Stentor coeruleus]|uniref:Uncharacterized protein n=1 Tax=Stentor coeruleus TaxID=5963 RepID=A0A1R2CE14_9CILI|nr:hypothetical protein SteCoe_11088 [Stentor coeruleus]
MSSVCTSLHTDRSESEDINLSLSHVSFSLDGFEAISNDKNMFKSSFPFPEVSFSIHSSNDNSHEVEFIKDKNKEIHQAIVYNVHQLKLSSKNLIEMPECSNLDDFIDGIKSSQISHEVSMREIDGPTRETEGNVEILHEIVCNVKKLNKNLESAKKSLNDDVAYIEKLTKEHDSLKKQLEEITSQICSSISIETVEKPTGKSSCQCLIV